MNIIHDKNIQIQISKNKFFDNRIQAIHEISIASNILCNLGNPLVCEKVIVKIDGFLESKIKGLLEKYLSNAMKYRTMVRYNCLLYNVPVEIIGNNRYIAYEHKIENRRGRECLLLYSKGLDSRLSYYFLSKDYLVHKMSWQENDNSNSDLNCKDFKIYNFIDTFDNDPWESYGLYFYYLSIALNKVLLDGIGNISIGLNKDDLYGYDIISNTKIFSQCSQSQDFIDLFCQIANIYEVDVLLPLKGLTRVDICKELIAQAIDIENSISCVFSDDIECGSCFSCFDKITGILVALAELTDVTNVSIVNKFTHYELAFKGKVLMRFKNHIRSFNSLEQLPIDFTMLVLINRVLLNEDIRCIKSSKFSIENTLKVLKYYSNNKIGKILFPRSCHLYNNNKSILEGCV